MVGDADRCKAASDLLLRRHDIYIQPINYPTVAIGTERLRITPTPRHTEAHVSTLVEALVDVWKTLDLPLATRASCRCGERRRSATTASTPRCARLRNSREDLAGVRQENSRR